MAAVMSLGYFWQWCLADGVPDALVNLLHLVKAMAVQHKAVEDASHPFTCDGYSRRGESICVGFAFIP